MGTNEGLRRAHAHSLKGGAEPVKGDVKRPGWGGGAHTVGAAAFGVHSGEKARDGEDGGCPAPGHTPSERTARTSPAPLLRPRLSDLGTNRIESAPAPGPELAN